MKYIFILVVIGSISALLENDPVMLNMEPEGRNQFEYGVDEHGRRLYGDSWLRASDLERAARYNPDDDNEYQLFTRQNPSVSQPLVYGVDSLVANSNFNAGRRTAVIIHGWTNNAQSEINAVLVPAFLSNEDMNVIVVDWGVGAADSNYYVSLAHTISSGVSVARFISWLNGVSGASLAQYHVVGHSLGGHQAGVVGRRLGGQVAYITSLDPAMPGWLTHPDRFASDDGVYTEVMHTNNYVYGFPTPLGQVDFFPNGGRNMPGCDNNLCSHGRAFFYMAESLISGGFTGARCARFADTATGNCDGERLLMGDRYAKTGRSGMFYLETNGAPPFSRG